MTLVGPRPAPVEERHPEDPVWSTLLAAKPGITGPGYLGRAAGPLSAAEARALDAAYVPACSARSDLRVAAATVRVLAGRSPAR